MSRSTLTPTRPAREVSGGRHAPQHDGTHHRFRQRRRSVERRRRRPLMLAVVALGVLTVLAVGGWFLLHSSVFSAKDVTVTGARGLQEVQVVEAAGVAGRPPLIDIDTAGAEARIEAIPWVQSASVVLHWPDAVEIDVVPRQAAAQLQVAGGRWAALDRTGRVLSVSATETPGLLAVAPAAPVTATPGSWVPSVDRPAVTVAAAVPPALVGQVASVGARAGGDVMLTLTSPLTVQFGQATQLHQKFEDVASLITNTTFAPGDTIDVTVPSSPIISPG